jgi:streptogramin lyase
MDRRRHLLPTLVIALLGALAPAGAAGASNLVEFTAGLTPNSQPAGITRAADGNLWVAGYAKPARIVRVTPGGDMTEFTAGLHHEAFPTGITAGPDGNVWFTESKRAAIGRITPQGEITEFMLGLSGNSNPQDIVAGPDGNLWFTERPGRIGRITPPGNVTEFSAGIPYGVKPRGITAGPDGNLWFTDVSSAARIGRITPTGTVTEFPVPTASSGPTGIAAGPDGNLWFTEANGNKIGQITTAGTVLNEFTVPSANAFPLFITAGPDGNLWFTESSAGAIARITTTGTITEFPIGGSAPREITSGPGGNLWFADFGANEIGTISTTGSALRFAVPTSSSQPWGITTGPDGNIWFSENAGHRIGRATISAAQAPVATTGNATSVSATSATLNGAVNPEGAAVSYHFEYGTTTAYGSSTPVRATSFADTNNHSVSEAVSGLTPNTTYHYRIVASNTSGTSNGVDGVFSTFGGTGPSTVPPPVFARTVNAEPVSGTVLVRAPGATAFVPLTAPGQIQVGSVIDTRHGRVRITIADRSGKLWSADFYEGLFKVTQLPGQKGFAEMVLLGGNRKACGRGGARAAGKPRGKSLRHLWASGSGPFRTKGKYASAAIRGTTWDTDDRCNGTLVKVTAGSVTVRDLVKKKNFVVAAGKQYFARARGR